MTDKTTELIAEARSYQMPRAALKSEIACAQFVVRLCDALEAEHKRAEEVSEVMAGADHTAAKYFRKMQDAQSNADEYHSILGWQSDALTGVVDAVRGEPGPLKMHSHHDVVELVQAVVAERDALRAALLEMADAARNCPSSKTVDEILSRAIDTKEEMK